MLHVEKYGEKSQQSISLSFFQPHDVDEFNPRRLQGGIYCPSNDGRNEPRQLRLSFFQH